MKYSAKLINPKQRLILSEEDYIRLYLEMDHEYRMGKMSRKRLHKIRDLLRDVTIYPVSWFPDDIITMNSSIELAEKDGSARIVYLVYPREANKEQRQVSVFSSLGMRLLGQRTGQTIKSGRMRIAKILYQPETLYHLHLHKPQRYKP